MTHNQVRTNINHNLTDKKVLFSVNNLGVAEVTLNIPDKHNAFDEEVIQSLTHLFTKVSKREDIKVLVLSAQGESFSAGADIAWMQRMLHYSKEDNIKDANHLAQMLKTLNFLPQPTIAKIQGSAFGGAVGLISCCDIAISSDHAFFCFSEVKLGLIPATISPYIINAIGQKSCRRYFLTAEHFSAETAKNLGLINEVVPLEMLEETTNKIIKNIINNGPQSTRQAKLLALELANQNIDDDLCTITSEKIAAIRVSTEGQEGLNAFLEKRRPNWQAELINNDEEREEN